MSERMLGSGEKKETFFFFFFCLTLPTGVANIQLQALAFSTDDAIYSQFYNWKVSDFSWSLSS